VTLRRPSAYAIPTLPNPPYGFRLGLFSSRKLSSDKLPGNAFALLNATKGDGSGVNELEGNK